MALIQPIKDALDSMDNVDKALVLLYIFGKDNTSLAISVGTAFAEKFYPWHPAPTNAEKALAILLQTREFVKREYVEWVGQSAGNQASYTAQVAAEAEVQYSDIGDLSQPLQFGAPV